MKKLISTLVMLLTVASLFSQTFWGDWWTMPANPCTWDPASVVRPTLEIYKLPNNYDMDAPYAFDVFQSFEGRMQVITKDMTNNFSIDYNSDPNTGEPDVNSPRKRLPSSYSDLKLAWGVGYDDDACYVFIKKTDDDNQVGDTSFRICWAGYEDKLSLEIGVNDKIIIPTGYEGIMADTSKMWLRWNVAQYGYWNNGYAGNASFGPNGIGVEVDFSACAQAIGNNRAGVGTECLPAGGASYQLPNWGNFQKAQARNTAFNVYSVNNNLYYIAKIAWTEFGFETAPTDGHTISLHVESDDIDAGKLPIRLIGSTGNTDAWSFVTYTTECYFGVVLPDPDPIPDPTPSQSTVIVNTSTLSNQKLDIDMTTALKSNAIYSYQFNASYDATKLQFIGTNLTNTQSENGTISVNTSTPGLLKVSFANYSQLSGEGTLLYLKFNIIDNTAVMPVVSDFLFNTTNATITLGTNSVYTLGDIDDNKTIQAYDAALVLRYSVGLQPSVATPLPWAGWRVLTADVDGIEGISANDASNILKFSNGIINSFPNDLKAASVSNSEITVINKDGALKFYNNGNLFAVNIDIDNNDGLGNPVFLSPNSLTASNVGNGIYNVGLASDTEIATGQPFLQIPVVKSSNNYTVFNMNVNGSPQTVSLKSTNAIASISNQIAIYPNPVNNKLNINGIGNSKIELFDLSGRTLLSTSIVEKGTIETSNLAIGLYTIRVTNTLGVYTQQIIKK